MHVRMLVGGPTLYIIPLHIASSMHQRSHVVMLACTFTRYSFHSSNGRISATAMVAYPPKSGLPEELLANTTTELLAARPPYVASDATFPVCTVCFLNLLRLLEQQL